MIVYFSQDRILSVGIVDFQNGPILQKEGIQKDGVLYMFLYLTTKSENPIVSNIG